MKKYYIPALVILVFLIIGSVQIYTPNINTISDQQLYTELVAIDGIGSILAQRCTEYRKLHKPIKIADLERVRGIGEARLKLIRGKFKE